MSGLGSGISLGRSGQLGLRAQALHTKSNATVQGCLAVDQTLNALIVEARKLEHGFRRIRAKIPYTLL